MAITDLELSAKVPDEKEKWIADSSSRGAGQFCARIVGSNKPVFYFRYTNHKGTQARITIGKYDKSGRGGLTLKDARSRASELSLLYQSGVRDLKGHLDAEQRVAESQKAAEKARLDAEKRAAEVEASRLTVLKLFEKWEAQHLINHKDKGKEIRRIFEKDVLPKIGDLPAHMVRKGNVMEIVDAASDRGAKRVAKRIFTSLRTMFRFAVERDLVEVDPTASIRKAAIGGKDIERDRVLTDNEIKLLAEQIPAAGLTLPTTVAIWVTLSTGCRISELMKARWEHINIEAQRWLIPSENSKNTLPLEVSLSDFALGQLKRLKQYRQSDWLYPARNKKRGDTHVSVKTVTKQIGDRQREKIKTKGTQNRGTLILPGGLWTMHDLRRTASTIMGDLGIKPEVIDRCLNHKEPNRVRRTYQRYSYQHEMKEAWALLGQRLQALTTGAEIAKIISIKRRG